MLQEVGDRVEPPGRAPLSVNGGSESSGDLLFILGAIGRHRMLVVLMLILGMAMAVAYLKMALPVYKSEAEILIDVRRLAAATADGMMPRPLDAATVDSQVQIIESSSLARAVVESERLAEDPEFYEPPFQLSNVLQYVGLAARPEPRTADERLLAAVAQLRDNVTASRIGFTYAISISVESLYAEKAMRLANAVAEAYIKDQLDAKYDATHRANLWMLDRVKELEDQVSAADKAVVDFKLTNNLAISEGRLVDEKQMSELSSQLAEARTQTAQTKARLDRIVETNKSGNAGTAVTDALTSEVITKLRQEFLDAQRRVGEYAGRLGARHEAVLKLRSEMRQIEEAIRTELRRIEATHRSDYEIARGREAGLEKRVDELFKGSARTQKAQIQLRQLDSTAQTYRSLYDGFLQRYTQAIQQQSFPITEARLITAASKGEKNRPKTMLILAMGLAASLMSGLFLAVALEFSDKVIRTKRQLTHVTGVDCLGILTKLPKMWTPRRQAAAAADIKGRTFVPKDRRYDYVAVAPFSTFAETLRSVKLAADVSRRPQRGQVIGLVSAVPGEGKSTVSANLAALVASTQAKSLLIDCDLRNPALSAALAPNAERGLIDLIAGRAELPDILWRSRVSNLHFVPAIGGERPKHTAEIIGSDEMKAFIETARATYDYVIVDLPPLLPVVDVRAASPFIDVFVMVVAWGSTTADIVDEALASPAAQDLHRKLLGTVLNKADERIVRRFGEYTNAQYAAKYFER